MLIKIEGTKRVKIEKQMPCMEKVLYMFDYFLKNYGKNKRAIKVNKNETPYLFKRWTRRILVK